MVDLGNGSQPIVSGGMTATLTGANPATSRQGCRSHHALSHGLVVYYAREHHESGRGAPTCGNGNKYYIHYV